MWRWLLGLTILFDLAVGAFSALGAEPSTGPTSTEEAHFLWKDGKSEFDNKLYRSASIKLERLIARYPGHREYLEAHCLLGRAFLELSEPEKALEPLRYCSSSAQKKGEGKVRAQLWLGRAELAALNFHEALLVAREVEKQSSRSSPDLLVQILILKAQAQLELDRLARARSALASAREETQKNPQGKSPILSSTLSELALTELRLKTHDCARLPGPGFLNELQVRNQLDRRGSCLLEALALFKDVLRLGQVAHSDQASFEVNLAFQNYSKACHKPPDPPETHPVRRTRKQLSEYRAELKAVLEKECDLKYTQASDLLKNWETQLPQALSGSIQGPLLKVSQTLKRLATQRRSSP